MVLLLIRNAPHYWAGHRATLRRRGLIPKRSYAVSTTVVELLWWSWFVALADLELKLSWSFSPSSPSCDDACILWCFRLFEWFEFAAQLQELS
jgi:hypothetical protein